MSDKTFATNNDHYEHITKNTPGITKNLAKASCYH